MARIAGVNIPDHKHTVIALQAIFGIGATRSAEICGATGIDPTTKVRELSEEQLEAIRARVDSYTTEGDLRREISMNIKRLIEIGSYRGSRHKRNLPSRPKNAHQRAYTPRSSYCHPRQ